MQNAFGRLVFFGAGLVGLLITAGCTPAGSTRYAAYQEAVSTPAVSRPYTLHTNNQVHIQVYNEQTITGDFVVDSAGYLSIPKTKHNKTTKQTKEQHKRRITA